MAHLPESDASREALESGDLSTAARKADLSDIRARWAMRHQGTQATRWWRYAAAAIILAFVAWSVVLYQESQRPVQLYAQHFAAQDNLDYLSLRSVEENTNLSPVVTALRNGQYREALALSQQLTAADPFAVQALLYQALAAMELEEYALAGRALDQALALRMPTADRLTARWYRALVYLASSDEAAARQELEWIDTNSQGQRGVDARALLEDLARE